MGAGMLDLRVRHGFDGFTLDAGFAAADGVTALFGRSGSGKTTLVNAVAGLLRPQAGRIALEDTVLFDSARGIDRPPHRRCIGYVFQDARLFPHMTVQQNLTYGRRFAGRGAVSQSRGVALARIVELLGLGDRLHRLPAALSGGEKQRVALGRAILSDPRLLLMDEPLAALDEPRKAEILTYLERLRDETRVPILYVSHSVAEIARLATTVVLMDRGRVVMAGPAEQVLSDPDAAPALGLREAGAIITARLEGHDTDGLSRLRSPAGLLWLPRVDAAAGALLRLRILAQDVMLATQAPVGISALNVLPMTVASVRTGDGPGALVQVQSGDMRLLARVPSRSARALGLAPGQAVFAVLKAVSVARGDIAGALSGPAAPPPGQADILGS